MRAYIFISTSAGKALEIARDHFRRRRTGQYDVIAACDADDLQRLGRLIVTKVQALKGVLSTRTSLVIR